ncbi:MAG: hypothetical protein GX957_00445, partial [Clostridiaceae bacterium]|nr:hypothetical protein [Clostridiaceae bacterium]
MYSKQRGSVTVFLCIVLAAIIPLSCLLTDLARFNMAKKQAKTALKITVESILAAYDRQLREQYGLFSIYPRDLDSMEKEIFDLLSDNLNVGVSAEGASDIYGFNVRSVKAIPFYNLSEPDVLEQQIAEFMKYRAPVQIIQEFYEKIKLMIGVMEEVEMIEDKMEVDRLMNDIREYLVRLHYMINDICSDFNVKPGNVNQTLKDDILNSLKWYQSYIEVLQENSNDETENIKEARKGYIDNYDNYEIARKNKEHAEQDLDSVNNKLDSKQKQLDNVKENLNKENEKEEKDQGKITSLNKKIADLEEEIEKLGERKEIAQATFDSANAKYNEIYKIIS